MKFFRFLTLTFLCACSSIQYAKEPTSFRAVRSLLIGKDTLDSVTARFGSPSKQESEKETIKLVYLDPKSNLPRLQLYFDEQSKRLLTALWLPRENEPEKNLEILKANFPEKMFRETAETSANSHALSPESVQYRASGVTIRYSNYSRGVEAIAFFEPNQRVPSSGTKE